MVAATRMVRIKPETHRRLETLAREANRSLPEVLDEAISEFERKVFLEGLHADFARLRADQRGWREEMKERAEWDCTLTDDLREEPVYPPPAILSALKPTSERSSGGSSR